MDGFIFDGFIFLALKFWIFFSNPDRKINPAQNQTMTTLSYGTNFDANEYKLFELNPELEKQLLHNVGNVVHLKGAVDGSTGTSIQATEGSTATSSTAKAEPPPRAGSIGDGGHVVLCGDGTTQQVRCSETSNLVLLVSETMANKSDASTKSVQAVGSTQRTFVLSTVAPRLDHLDATLNEFIYVPPSSTFSTTSSSTSTSSSTTTSSSSSSSAAAASVGVSMDALESRVQASREQILNGLAANNIPAVPGTIPQRWCKLHPSYVIEVKGFNNTVVVECGGSSMCFKKN